MSYLLFIFILLATITTTAATTKELQTTTIYTNYCLFVNSRLVSEHEITTEASHIYVCSSETPADSYDYYIYKLKRTSAESLVNSIKLCAFIYNRAPENIAFIDKCANYSPALDYSYTVFEIN